MTCISHDIGIGGACLTVPNRVEGCSIHHRGPARLAIESDTVEPIGIAINAFSRQKNVTFDTARPALQNPVSSSCIRASPIGRRGYVRSRHGREKANEFYTGSTPGDVATIEEDVSIIAKRRPDAGKSVRIFVQISCVQSGLAKLDFARPTVTYDMNAVQVLHPFERCRHLRKSIVARVDQNDPYIASGVGDKRLPIRNFRIHKYDLRDAR